MSTYMNKFFRAPQWMIFIFILALLLRSVGITARPIWYDEAFTMLFASQSPEQILNNTLFKNSDSSAAEEHPPLYYFGLWAWLKLFGVSISAARAFSILLSLLVILLIYQIAKKLFDPVSALVSAAIASLLPFQVHYAQELRMYSMLTFWLALTTLAFLHARTGNWKWWLVFAASAAFSQYTHNLAAIYLIPLALTPIFQRDWKTLRSLIFAGFCALILYLPWMLQLPAQFAKVSSSFWVERPGIERFFTLILFYLPHLPLPGIQLMVGFFLAMMLLTLAAFQTYLGWKRKVPSSRRGLWTAYLAFTPPLLLWLVSQFVPVYIERALLPAHALFCIWLAWAFTQTKVPRFIQGVAVVLVAATAFMGINQHIKYSGFPYGDYAKINASLQEQSQTGDVIVHSSKLTYLPAFYFSPQLAQGFIADPPNSSVDTLSKGIRQTWDLTEYESIESATDDAERVWFIIFKQSIEEYTAQGLPTHPQLEYLETEFTLASLEEWDDIQVYLFVRQ